ncbi:MAG: haloacid dehalogenase superfamily protein subfamily variant 3 with third motif having or, partial [Actinomycetia bacterium]|nr:haloacid dehalogenase superfamily protein subfamily variant 3 with third motif having or [Actinomycetes bacterium]
MTFEAVIFDLGGVVFPSPFEAFDAYERDTALPEGSVRGLIRTSSETGAWAALERSELTLEQFHAALEAEARLAGFALEAEALMHRVASAFAPRPEMVHAITRLREAGLRTAALTNNWVAAEGERNVSPHEALAFDVIVESAVEGLRKPDRRIYELVLDRLGVDAKATVFLDDLGINLKPARAIGM